MHIFKINCRVFLLLFISLLLIAPVTAINLASSESLAADPPSNYTLTTNINPVDAGIVILTPSQPEGGYSPGTVVTLTANPVLSPYQFDHWSGDISATYYQVSVTMDSDKDINAHFISTPLKSDLDQIRSNVDSWRDLSPLEDINHWFITQEELGQMVDDELEESVDDIALSQEMFVLLDMLEEDQDLYTIVTDLYSGAILGMYDYEVDKLYIIGDIESFDLMDETTYAHEYTHALQDQNFDLGSLGLDSEDNSDIYQAVTSLMEGDASFLEVVYYYNVFDDAEREIYDQLQEQSGSGIYDEFPEFIVEDLLFPYTTGLGFVYAVWEDGGGWEGGGGWAAVNDVYSDLPQSTEQIIHPEKYLERDEPQTVTLPDLEAALGGTWSQLETDTLGELYMKLYLEAFIDTDQAATAAEGWDGDRCAYLKDASDNKMMVISSVWDTTNDASEFLDAYIAFMQEKTDDTWSLSINDSTTKWWQTDGSSVFLSQNNREILLVLAPGEATTEQVLTEFPAFYTPPEEPVEEPEEEPVVEEPEEELDQDQQEQVEEEPDQDQQEDPEEEENGEAGGCSCSCANLSAIPATELLAGWGIIGMCWGGGYYLVKRNGKRRR